MLIVALFLVLITVVVCLVQSASFSRLRAYVETELTKKTNSFQPKASVILPCKGLDPGFDENIRKLLDQDYTNFEVIFAVADEADPAFSRLIEISGESRVPTQVVVAGIDSRRAQKINNQLSALKNVSADSEVLVFVDSDVIARGDFLSRLVDPLADSEVGATTGYRFYIASPSNWASVLRSLWNRMSAWEMASPRYAFAWGGAMAIRRSVFNSTGVANSWEYAADDDLSLTTCVKKQGLRVHFVPQCLVASDGDSPIPEIIEWTNRQLILTKVYYPELWRRAIVRAFVMLAWLVAMSAATLGWIATGDSSCALAVLAGLSIIPVEVWLLLRARGLWERILSDRSEYLKESLLSSCLAIPIAHVALPFLTLYSLLTNRIQWRGVRYELKSPTETLVLS